MTAKTYIILAASCRMVKIGQSTAPHKRFAELSAASPCELTLVAIINDPQYNERVLHQYFAPYHHHNEWFEWRGELETWLAAFLEYGNYTLKGSPVFNVSTGATNPLSASRDNPVTREILRLLA